MVTTSLRTSAVRGSGTDPLIIAASKEPPERVAGPNFQRERVDLEPTDFDAGANDRFLPIVLKNSSVE